MTPKRMTEPDSQSQEILHTWRKIFEKKYSNELDAISRYEEDVFGFNVEWEDLVGSQLHSLFPNNPNKALDLGNQVLLEQFQNRNCRTIPKIRIVDLPDDFHYVIDDLRMRDANRLLNFDAVVTKVDNPMGWLKVSKYTCRDCGHVWEIEQRLARERIRAKYCSICLEELLAKSKRERFIPPENIEMVVHENEYSDVQYVELSSPLGLSNIDEAYNIRAVISDEYVGTLKPGSRININAFVRIDHLPNRDYQLDTRRVLLLDIHSIEFGFKYYRYSLD